MWYLLLVIPLSIFLIYIAILKFIYYRKTNQMKKYLIINPAKRILSEPSLSLKKISNLVSVKHLNSIFKNFKVFFIHKKILFNHSQNYDTNYYLNLLINQSVKSTYIKEHVPQKYWNHFLIEDIYLYSNLPDKKNLKTGLREGIVNCIFHICGGNKMYIPYRYNFYDTYFLLLQGNVKINLNPSNPIYYEGIPYIKDYEEEGIEYDLRGGDFLFIPAGTIYKIRYQMILTHHFLVEIHVSEFPKDFQKDFIRTQVLQNREIKTKFKLHNLSNKEVKYFWKKKYINSLTKDSNLFISNPMMKPNYL